MKQPLQALLVANDHGMRTNILYGAKAITIREGHRDYKPGPVMLCCHEVPWAVMADIVSVRHCTLQEVTEEELGDDGFTSHDNMLEGIRNYYSTVTMASPVTVINWTGTRGFLVDNAIFYGDKPSELYGIIEHGEP